MRLYVGYSESLKIEHTYRNSQELVNIASRFIEKNPEQIHKSMNSEKHEDMPLVISYLSNMAEGLESSLGNIFAKGKGNGGSVLILGRHNFDIETIYPEFKGESSYSNGRISLMRDRKSSDVHVSFNGSNDICEYTRSANNVRK